MDPRADRLEREQPAAGPPPGHREQLLGRRRGRPVLPAEVQAWVAAGIFPAFSNGNNGPACGTAGSPGDLPETYAAGAFAQNGTIAGFSCRGPSAFGGIIKPNIAAPGSDVRSSLGGSDTQYGSLSGTSMASPHVAGTVALIWSISPELRGDITRTEQLLDQTATDVDNTTCGGTAADNNVWGEGKLNALAAVTAAPKGPTGTLAGTVRRADTMAAIGGAEVHVTGPGNRGVGTSPTGQYSMLLPVGTYTVSVTAHGFARQTVSNVDVTQDATTTKDFNLAPIPALEHHLTTLTEPGGNGKVDPGETFQLDEELINTGHATATGVSATLSTTTRASTSPRPPRPIRTSPRVGRARTRPTSSETRRPRCHAER